MIRVNVSVSSISAERFLDFRQPVPQIQINTNLNLTGMDKKPDDSLEIPYVLTINYNPSVAQINMKGRAFIIGEKSEVDMVYRDYQEKKPPPPIVVQSISNVAFVEAVVISRTLNVPPPIPLPQIPTVKPADTKQASGKEYTA